MSFYKNNSHLIANLIKNLANTDVMEEFQTLPLNSMLNMVKSLMLAIQSITKPKNLLHVKLTEQKENTKTKISFFILVIMIPKNSLKVLKPMVLCLLPSMLQEISNFTREESSMKKHAIPEQSIMPSLLPVMVKTKMENSGKSKTLGVHGMVKTDISELKELMKLL